MEMRDDQSNARQRTRREMLRTAVAIAGAGLCGGKVLARPPKTYWPRGKDWETRTAKDAGMDATAIEDAVKYAAEHNSTGLVILRGGRIVTEQYWQKWTPETAQPIFSSSKSITATLVGMAIEERKWLGRTPAMAAGLTTHCWGVKELLSYRVPPPRWRPPKRRGRISAALQEVLQRWG